MKKILLILALLAAANVTVLARETSEEVADSVSTQAKIPFFEQFRPMFIATGFPVSEKPTANNSDIKFQYSFRLNILRNPRGKEFQMFFGFTQLSEWSLYAHSSPFYDNTYMPGGYFEVPFRSKKTGEITSEILCGYEHRSNGRDDIYSRSVNYVFCTYSYFLPCDLTLQVSGRFGDSWYGDTHTFAMYTKYLGFVNFAADYVSPKKHFDCAISVTPLWNKNIANVTAEIGGRFGRSKNIPYFFIQYHYGYDEALRECRTVVDDVMDENNNVYYNGADPFPPRHMLRFGITFTPQNRASRCLY